MATKAPYYYSEIFPPNKNAQDTSDNLGNIKPDDSSGSDKSRGFHNPLLSIEPDISTSEPLEKPSVFQKKKKKKKKGGGTPMYRRSNSLVPNGVHMSPSACYARREFNPNIICTPDMNKSHGEHRRRSSEPNIYEEISESTVATDSDLYSGSIGAFSLVHRRTHPNRNRKSGFPVSDDCTSNVVSDEVAKVHQRHEQILENLNLDVEAMLMPDDSICPEELETKENLVSPERRIDSSSKNTQSPGTPPLYFAASRWQSSNQQHKQQPTYQGRRVMNEYILQQSDFGGSVSSKGQSQHIHKGQQLSDSVISGKVGDEPLYMLYDDSHKHQQLSSRDSVVQASPEDNIYEEVDLQHLAKNENDNANWLGSGCAENSFASSGSEEEETGAAKLAARLIGKRKKSSKKFKDVEGITGGFTRWFSTRRKEYELEKCMHRIIKNQEEETYIDVKVSKKQRPPLSLPPIPHDLSPEKVKRRYIVGSIVDSENSYVNSLQRLIKDFKRPLEDSNPPIVSANKIGIMFHRVEQILQCHTIFGIALTQCVRQWDDDEKIGDVFVASFSKTMVLDIYSDFINNFSLAMETAKQASKNKSAFADFLKVKQITSPDRLSFFGLMVKPVQRFPQFILLLQDLLKHTPAGHHDRMSLQLALTQLESLAETLNERKRESEQHHAVREVLKHLGKFSLKTFSDRDHYLLRQDDVLQLHLDSSGIVVKSKDRRIFLLNDLLVCVSVTARSSDAIPSSERLSLKWAVSLQEIEVHEDVAPATKNLLASSSRTKYPGRNNERHSCGGGTMQTLYDELSDLVHDLEVMSRITALISTLRHPYGELTVETLQRYSHSIQESIRQKDEEITLLDSSCLQLAVPIKSRSPKEVLYFQMATPAVKRDWTTDLRLAKLALDPNNTPAWHIPDQEKRPSSKMPLFVKSTSVCTANCATEVKCGCYSKICNGTVSPQQYLWLCSSDGVNSHLVVMAVHQKLLKQVAAYDLNEMRIITMEAVQGCSPNESIDDSLSLPCDAVDTVWLGTDSRKIILLRGSCPERWEELGSTTLTAAVVQIKYHCEQVFVALANGCVVIFRKDIDGCWQLQNPIIVTIDIEQPITCILPLGLTVYCACGNKVWVVDALTAEIQKNYTIQSENDAHVYLLAHSGTGLWITLKNSATIRLYHTETFHHLQDINVASNIDRLLTGKLQERAGTIYVTSLLASRGLLWVGTNVGVSLTVPLPRLEGVPIISGRTNVAYHAHQGAVTMLLSLQVRPSPAVVLPSPLPVANKTVQVHEPSANPKARVQKQKSDSMLPSPAFGKRLHGFSHRSTSDVHSSGAKTLPRSMTFCPHSHLSQNAIDDTNDVYDLYADLMNIQDYEKDSQEKVYERLNHSDPELVNFHLTTLDRRLQQKTGRPRSWDLSAMAVSEDSDSSAAYDSTSTATSIATTAEVVASSPESHRLSEDSSSPSHPSTVTLMPSVTVVQSDVQKTNKTLNRTVRKTSRKSMHDTSQKTVLMLTGGCGYVNWRKSTEKETKLMSDAHVILWEMKL